MSIANELSCDIATAMLTDHSDPQSDKPGEQLTGIVLEAHTTLRRLTTEARQRRVRAFEAAAAQASQRGDSSSESH